MVSFTQKTVFSKQDLEINTQDTRQSKRCKIGLMTSALISLLSLSACQTMPNSTTATPQRSSPPVVTQSTTVTQAPVFDDNNYEDNYPIEPYIPPYQTNTTPTESAQPVLPYDTRIVDDTISTQQPDISDTTNSVPVIPIPDTTAPSSDSAIPSMPSTPSHSDLLERARQNSQQRSQRVTSNNSNLPAFRNLMQTGTEQLRSGNLTAAESSFTRAQRLAPKSSAVYFYLAQVALKKNQPRKAEAMARRGLSVSQDANRRRALWQIILQSGQRQNNSRVIREAKQALR